MFGYVIISDVHHSLRITPPLLNIFFWFQNEWFGNSIYELIHPDDIDKVREQLSTTESQNTGRILDLKSKTNLKDYSK